MPTVNEKHLRWLASQETRNVMPRRGLEKEGLRVDESEFISQADHPKALGSALCHDSITTDYSEALLEFITPVKNTPKEALDYLADVQAFSYKHLKKEVIWPASMPSRIENELSIRIADYGKSNTGQIKHIYRHGLWHRYGRIMQTIAGLHYNFSLPEEFWQSWAEQLGVENDKDFVSDQYFNLIRNFRRYSWLLLYLFGASPAVDRSFFSHSTHSFTPVGDHSCVENFATSLRMSDMGYSNNAQKSLKVCFNSLPTYLSTLARAIHTPHAPYASLGMKDENGQYKQLNSNILQIENEYYSDIRPKRVAMPGEKPINALNDRGIEYIEVRCMDLDPFSPEGISEDTMQFLDLFLIWCLMLESPENSDADCERIEYNKKMTVLYGRDPNINLIDDTRIRTIKGWGRSILAGMSELSSCFNSDPQQLQAFNSTLAIQRERLEKPELTLSGKMLAEIKTSGMDFSTWALNKAQEHKDTIASRPLSPSRAKMFSSQVETSWKKQEDLESLPQKGFDDFLEDYLNS